MQGEWRGCAAEWGTGSEPIAMVGGELGRREQGIGGLLRPGVVPVVPNKRPGARGSSLAAPVCLPAANRSVW